MSNNISFDNAVSTLKSVWKRALAGDEQVLAISNILDAGDKVIPRYQQVFAPKNLSKLTEEDFRQFLHFKNNQHWMSLQRMGPAICDDMKQLREALRILIDERRPIRERLNELVPAGGPAFVPRLGKAVLTPILLICFPEQYGVWNQVSEGSMKSLNLWPEFERGIPFGDRYIKVNKVLLDVAKAVGVDLWTLDALWWRVEELLKEGVTGEHDEVEADDETEVPLGGARFGLERHLQEFLRDNWSQTDLGRDWSIYEEDGDPEAGYEYPCDIGRIDILARHHKKRRWLVIELKRNQSGDETVGQVLRYMGWVKQKLAESGDKVEGLVIAHQANDKIHYALAAVPDVRLQLYEVQFRLADASQK